MIVPVNRATAQGEENVYWSCWSNDNGSRLKLFVRDVCQNCVLTEVYTVYYVLCGVDLLLNKKLGISTAMSCFIVHTCVP